MKFTFSSKAVGDGFSVARIVKPELGDFCMRFESGGLVIFSYDKRRYVRVAVGYSSSECPPGFSSEECYVTPEKTALFDSDLDTVTVKLNEGSVAIKAQGGGQSRQASMKRRAKRSKRTPVPSGVIPASAGLLLEVRKDLLDEVLGHLMCSAVVGKTEDEMRVNQIHFYASKRCAMSMTRFYGTAVIFRDDQFPDFSVIGSDAAAIRTFATRAPVDLLSISQDKHRLYVSDGLSSLSMTRVSGKTPQVSLASDDLFAFKTVVNHGHLSKALAWACMAVQDEGTSRVRFQTEGDELVMSYNNEEISRTKTGVSQGTFSADFQVKHLRHIVDHIQGDVRIFYSHKEDPTLMALAPASDGTSYYVRHYMKAMVER